MSSIKYRVIVEAVGTDEDETLFEMTGGARLIRQIVPGVLADLLDESTTASPASPTAASIFDSAVEAGVAAGALPAGTVAGPPPAAPEPVKAKRPRRTKEQIAADEAAKQQATAPSQPETAPLVTQPHDVAAGAVPVIGQPVAEASPATPPAVPAAPAGEPVFNPFAVTG